MSTHKRLCLRVSKTLSSLIILSISFQNSLSAPNEADTIRKSQLKEVVVIGIMQSEVIPAQRLHGDQLQRLSSHSVADAIRFFSGIQIKDFGGIGGLKTVDIRSMGTNHTGVFYDGLAIGNAQNGQVDLGKFSLDLIEEVNIYFGQKSSDLQPAKDFASAGSIYLKTRRPKFIATQSNNFRTLIRTGSFDLINPSILWEHKLSRSIATSFNTEYTRSSGKYKFRYRKTFYNGSTAWDTTAVRQNGDIEALRLEGGIFGYNGTIQWNAKAYMYHSEKGIPGAIVNNVWKRSQRQWDQNYFVQSSIQYNYNRRYNLLINGKYAIDYMRYLNPDTTLMYIDNHFTQQEIYLSIAQQYAILPQWSLSIATDMQYNTLNASLQNFTYPQRLSTLLALASSYETKRFKIQASVLSTWINEHANESEAPDKKELTPSLFASFKPFRYKELHLRAFYKRIFRMPTFNDLYYTDIGNISLLPEYTNQYNIGVQYTITPKRSPLRSITLTTDAYYNEVTNKIIAVPKGTGQFRWMMMNLGYVEIRGIDASAQLAWKLPFDISMRTHLNYTYQKAQDYSDPTDNDPIAGTWGSQIAYIPSHNGSISWMTNFRKWELNYSFIYVGERYHNSSNIRANYAPAWYTSDLSASYEFQLHKSTCRLSAEVNNLLDQQYDVVLNYPMPGRNFKFIIKLNI